MVLINMVMMEIYVTGMLVLFRFRFWMAIAVTFANSITMVDITTAFVATKLITEWVLCLMIFDLAMLLI